MSNKSEPRTLRDVTARGVRMRVLEAGDEEAPALLLIHGFLASHREFDDVTWRFAEKFHVIAPDLPGFGESEKPNPSRYAYGIESATEAIADLIAAFGVGRAMVLGHGMGGTIALTLAAQHAELVQRLVVEDALIYPSPSSWRWRLVGSPIIGGSFFKQLWGRAMFRGYFRDEVFKGSPKMPLDRIDAHYAAFNAPSARESAHATWRAIGDTRPTIARLSRITVPTLIVWGREDPIYPAQSAQRLARELRSAKLEILDAAHSPHEEEPQRFVDLVTQFLEGKRQ